MFALRWGRRGAHTLPSLQNGCIMLGRWSPHHLYVLLQTLSLDLGDASAPLVPPLSIFWPTKHVHKMTIVATTVPLSSTMATLQQPHQWFCSHSAPFEWPIVRLQSAYGLKSQLVSTGSQGSIAQLHRQDLLVLGNNYRRKCFGCSKVTGRSQPCV